MTSTDGLRPFVEAVDREMTRLVARVGASDDDTTGLLSAWARLVEFLALGPAPELRACPYCGGAGMRAATLCGTCWRRLDPTASATTAPGERESAVTIVESAPGAAAAVSEAKGRAG